MTYYQASHGEKQIPALDMERDQALWVLGVREWEDTPLPPTTEALRMPIVSMNVQSTLWESMRISR